MIERAGFSLDHRVLAAQPPPDDASAASRPRDEGPAVVSKAAAQLVLASGDVPRVCETLVSVALNEPDWRWAQERCLAFTAHSDARVRAVAARSLGHLARIHGQLDLDAVMSRLKVLFEDAETAGYAEAAIEDVERFILRTP